MRPRIALVGSVLVVLGVMIALMFLVARPHGTATAASPQQKSASAKSNGSDIRIDLGGAQESVTGSQPDSQVSAAADSFTGDIVDLKARPILLIKGRVNVVAHSSNATLQAAYAKIRNYMSAHGLVAAGAPIAITDAFDQARHVWSYEAGIPLAAAPSTPPGPADGGIVLGETYAGTAARFPLIGDPSKAELTYAKIDQWMRANGVVAKGASWEEYPSDPSTPADQWRSYVYMPIG